MIGPTLGLFGAQGLQANLNQRLKEPWVIPDVLHAATFNRIFRTTWTPEVPKIIALNLQWKGAQNKRQFFYIFRGLGRTATCYQTELACKHDMHSARPFFFSAQLARQTSAWADNKAFRDVAQERLTFQF